MDVKALDAVWACLVSGKKLRIEELASKTRLTREVVDDVIGFLARYDFVSVAPDSSSVVLRDGAVSPHAVATILELLISKPSFSDLRWN